MQIKTLVERDITKQDIIDFINKMADKLEGDTMIKENETDYEVDDETNEPVEIIDNVNEVYRHIIETASVELCLSKKEEAIFKKTKKIRTKKKYMKKACRRSIKKREIKNGECLNEKYTEVCL